MLTEAHSGRAQTGPQSRAQVPAPSRTPRPTAGAGAQLRLQRRPAAADLPASSDRLGRILARAVTEEEADAFAAQAPEAVPTYNAKTKDWDQAAARGAPTVDQDGRRFAQAEGGATRQRAVFKAVGAVTTIDELDALPLAVVEDINPRSIVPYKILHDVLHESWHVAKEVLLDPDSEHKAKRRAVMTKLWEYRQWHHQEILAEVAQELRTRENDAKALLASKGGGSVTLSSDIDVNLKGTHTELAVALFNARFRNSRTLPQHRWTHEPGVVYDVNVYAKDFMHEFAPRESGGHRVTLKEGARPGHELGGFDDPVLLERDRHEQLVTALFKARLFMNPAQWEKYEELTMQGLNGPVRAPQEQAFRDAERRFSDYLRTMAAAMDVKLPRYPAADVAGVDQLRNAAAAKAPGSGHAAIAAQENVLMTAANRIYEDKLAVIHRLRGRLATWIGKLDAATPTRRGMIEGYIENLLQELRVLISEAAMYANEASMTDATVHHVVVGLQGGAGIEQQKSEGVNAVHENLADAMKEAGRHGPDLGHGAFKAGKYLMRMADAGKNLGFGYIWGVQMFYDLGHMISEEIKGDAEQGLVEPHAASAEAVRELAQVDTLDELLGLAMQTAADITREYSNERIVRGGPDTQTAYGYRTVGKGERNEHLLNQDMVHPIDRDNPLALKDLAALAASGRLGVRN